MLHQIARTIVRRASRNGTRSSSHAPSDFKHAHMDEIPVPQGSWQKNYDEKQKLYNVQLAAGLAIITGTLGFVIYSPLMFFNWGPPKPKAQ